MMSDRDRVRMIERLVNMADNFSEDGSEPETIAVVDGLWRLANQLLSKPDQPVQQQQWKPITSDELIPFPGKDIIAEAMDGDIVDARDRYWTLLSEAGYTVSHAAAGMILTDCVDVAKHFMGEAPK